MSKSATILFVGDVVGGLGKRTLLGLLPSLKARLQYDFLVVNGENAAGGLGITPKIADQLFAAGVDVITLGNHTYRQREIYPYLDAQDRILRPANYLRSQPGHGVCVLEHRGVRLGVVSLSGSLFMDVGRPAFLEADSVLEGLDGRVDHVIVDMHAEATSEKVGLGWYLDGRVTAVVGTHTHVPTADAHVLPKGTAYITDVGMVGPRDSIIGSDPTAIIERYLTQMYRRLEMGRGPVMFNAVVIELAANGRATSIHLVQDLLTG
ncbi:MAG: TIGR00282 family metallophosphoesterase [Candidatus Dormibacteria bacterium]